MLRKNSNMTKIGWLKAEADSLDLTDPVFRHFLPEFPTSAMLPGKKGLRLLPA
jgi:hypothetical protein